jgi:hypothetical protein
LPSPTIITLTNFRFRINYSLLAFCTTAPHAIRYYHRRPLVSGVPAFAFAFATNYLPSALILTICASIGSHGSSRTYLLSLSHQLLTLAFCATSVSYGDWSVAQPVACINARRCSDDCSGKPQVVACALHCTSHQS